MDVIKARDVSGRCYNQKDGNRMFVVVDERLKRKMPVIISFEGVDTVPSSFVNAALIALLEKHSFADIRAHVAFSNTTRQINEMIKTRFDFETSKRAR